MSVTTTPDPEDQPIDIDEDGEFLAYANEHEMGAQGRMMDEFPEPDSYLEAAYEDRYDMGGDHDF